MKPKFKLIGSAPSVEELRDLIVKRMSWNSVSLDLNTGTVSVGGKSVEGLRVINKSGRIRLEREVLI